MQTRNKCDSCVSEIYNYLMDGRTITMGLSEVGIVLLSKSCNSVPHQDSKESQDLCLSPRNEISRELTSLSGMLQ